MIDAANPSFLTKTLVDGLFPRNVVAELALLIRCSWFWRQGRSRGMARSVVAADLLLNSSLSQPCLPESTHKMVAPILPFKFGMENGR